MRLGAHMSTGGGVSKALQRGKSIGCEIVQIFVKNNMQWVGKPPAPDEIVRFQLAWTDANLHSVFGHAGYLINLGAPPSINRDRSLQSLIQEVEFATALKLPFLVLHPGAHLGNGEASGLQQIIAGLDEVIAATPHSKVRLALENTAGQGTCLGNRVSHLATIFDGVNKCSRLGLCLDTAHFLAAGYDIRTPAGWDQAIGEIDELIGVEQILAFHLNDSKTDLGSRVDRHAHIGSGKLGLEGFRHIVTDSRFKNHPGCLETPKSDDLHEDVENLARLRSLVTRKSKR